MQAAGAGSAAAEVPGMPAAAGFGSGAAAVASGKVLAFPPDPALDWVPVGRETEAGGSRMEAAGSSDRRTGETQRSNHVEAEAGGRKLVLLQPLLDASAPAAAPAAAAAAAGIASADGSSATVIEVAVDGRVVPDPMMPERTRADSSWSTVLPLALLLSAARRPEGRAAAGPGRNGDPWVVLAGSLPGTSPAVRHGDPWVVLARGAAATSPVGVSEGDGVAGVWPEDGVGSSRWRTALRAGGPAGEWDGGEERKGPSEGCRWCAEVWRWRLRGVVVEQAAAAAGGGEEKEAEGCQGLEGEVKADSLVLMVAAGDGGRLPEGASVDACGVW